MNPTPTDAAVLPSLPEQVWRELFWQMARKLGCLPSTFPDANDHVFRAADRYIGLSCKTCSGHGLVGHMTADGGEGWECPDCHGSGALAALSALPQPAAQQGKIQDHLAACAGGGVTQPLTQDEILAVIDDLSVEHRADDFEPECPACTALVKLRGMVAAPSGEGA